MNIIFDLTSSFKYAYGVKIKKTQIQKVLESRLVAFLFALNIFLIVRHKDAYAAILKPN